MSDSTSSIMLAALFGFTLLASGAVIVAIAIQFGYLTVAGALGLTALEWGYVAIGSFIMAVVVALVRGRYE